MSPANVSNRPRRAAARLATGLLATSLVLSACSDSEPVSKPQPSKAPTSQAPVSEVTVGLYGPKTEKRAYEAMIREFNAAHSRINVTLSDWGTQQQASAAVRNGAKLPDVFLADYTDFGTLVGQNLVQPVSTLLDERGVSFGDRFDRNSIEAFSSDNMLQCIPYELSPQVLFYNTKLVNLEQMTAASVDAPSPTRAWTWAEFSAAATWAAKPKRGIRGLAVEPTFAGLGSFLYSAGAQLVDDETEPSTLTFSDESTTTALQQVLPLLRDPKVTLGKKQLAQKSPLEWFKEGKVAIIEGTREMVPELRATQGLAFDVARMPKIAENATTASLNGLCISSTAQDPDAAADLITDLVDDESLMSIAELGYSMPANVSVAGSDAVTQPTLSPANGGAFVLSARTMRLPFNVPDVNGLEKAVAPQLQSLLFEGPTLDLAAITARIDEVSAATIASQRAAQSGATHSPQPSGSATASGQPSDQVTAPTS